MLFTAMASWLPSSPIRYAARSVMRFFPGLKTPSGIRAVNVSNRHSGCIGQTQSRINLPFT